MANEKEVIKDLCDVLTEIRDCFKYWLCHPEASDGPVVIRVSRTPVSMMHKKILAALANARTIDADSTKLTKGSVAQLRKTE